MLVPVTFNLLFLFVWKASADLPSYFPRCDLEDPDVSNCIASAAETLRPHVRNGISEIKFPSLDPLVISTLALVQESDKVDYASTVWNFTVRGLENYHLTNVRYDPKSKTFNGKIALKAVALDFDVEIHGTVLTIPIEGKGKFNGRFDNINGEYEINGELVRRKGSEYYRPTNVKIRMTIEDAYYHFDGLFDGNKELERLTNDMLNQNSKTIIDAVTPLLEKLSESGLMYLMRSLTESAPYNKLFY